jgi:hypothetical protein
MKKGRIGTPTQKGTPLSEQKSDGQKAETKEMEISRK